MVSKSSDFKQSANGLEIERFQTFGKRSLEMVRFQLLKCFKTRNRVISNYRQMVSKSSISNNRQMVSKSSDFKLSAKGIENVRFQLLNF